MTLCMKNRPLPRESADVAIEYPLASHRAKIQNLFYIVRYALYTLLHAFLTQPHRLKDEMELDDKKRVVYMLFAWSNKHMTQDYQLKVQKDQV